MDLKEYYRRYYIENKEKMLNRAIISYYANRNVRNQRALEYYYENREKILTKLKARYQSKKQEKKE